MDPSHFNARIHQALREFTIRLYLVFLRVWCCSSYTLPVLTTFLVYIFSHTNPNNSLRVRTTFQYRDTTHTTIIHFHFHLVSVPSTPFITFSWSSSHVFHLQLLIILLSSYFVLIAIFVVLVFRRRFLLLKGCSLFLLPLPILLYLLFYLKFDVFLFFMAFSLSLRGQLLIYTLIVIASLLHTCFYYYFLFFFFFLFDTSRSPNIWANRNFYLVLFVAYFLVATLSVNGCCSLCHHRCRWSTSSAAVDIHFVVVLVDSVVVNAGAAGAAAAASDSFTMADDDDDDDDVSFGPSISHMRIFTAQQWFSQANGAIKIIITR